MQDLQIFVALEFAELHEAAWAFGDDDIGAGGFEIFIFVFEHFSRSGWKIDLEGAGAASTWWRFPLADR